MLSLEKMRARLHYGAYYYQQDNYHRYGTKSSVRSIVDSFLEQCSRASEYPDKFSLWNMNPTPLGDAKPYSFEDLEAMTLDFHPSLMLKKTRYGRLFGCIYDESTTIKIWDFSWPAQKCYVDHPSRFCNELEILLDENRHSCLMKLKGFCIQKVLAVVYDERPAKYLSNVLHSGKSLGLEDCEGKSFQVEDRVKVATQLASLFSWLHERGFELGGMEPSSIMIDTDFNIKVMDFGFLVRVMEEDNRVTIPYSIHPDAPEACDGPWSLKAGVYVFGVLLVRLFVNNENLPTLQDGKVVIVDKSLLEKDYDDELACGIMELAAECLDEDPNARPDMRDVFTRLSNLVNKPTLNPGRTKLNDLLSLLGDFICSNSCFI